MKTLTLEDLPVGTEVVLKNYLTYRGTVISNTLKRTKVPQVAVEWHNGGVSSPALDTIMLATEVDSLDSEFNRFKAEVHSKVNQAIALMKEATDLAAQRKYTVGDISDPNLMDDLENTAERTSWTSSTKECYESRN